MTNEFLNQATKLSASVFAHSYEFAHSKGVYNPENKNYIGKNKDKFEQQILEGKLGEFAAYQVLKKYYPGISKPDLKIYPPEEKNHGADLTCGDLQFHVKTQHIKQAKKYGFSWMFQKGIPILTCPSENDFVVLVTLASDSEATVLGVFEAEFLLSLYATPVVPYIRDKKRALYLVDIRNKLKSQTLPEDCPF